MKKRFLFVLFTFLLFSGFSCSILDPYQKGIVYYENGEYYEADKAITYALRNHEPSAKAYFYLGKTYIELGRDAKALEKFIHAYEMEPDYPAAALEVGKAMVSLGIGGDSIPYLIQAVKLEPENSDAHFWLGVAYQRAGDSEKAVVSFSTSLALDPSRDDILPRLASLSREQLGGDRAFDQLVETILNENEENALRDFKLGKLHWDLDRKEEAALYFRACLEKEAANFEASYYLSLCLGKDEKYQDALEVLESAVSHTTDYPAIYNELSNIYLVLQRHSEAADAYRRYLELSGIPITPEINKHLEELKESH